MAVKISSGVLEQVLRAAGASPDAEVCGLLLGTAEHVTEAIPCRNVAADPATAFEIDPAQLIAAHRAARGGVHAIVGCYHSHPGGAPRPSPIDADAAAPDGAVWLIVAGGVARCYLAVEGGRDHGRFDAVAFRAVDLAADLQST